MGELWVQVLPRDRRRSDELRAHYTRFDRSRNIARYVELVSREPDNYRFHNELGHHLVRAGRVDEAVASFREAVRLAPDYVHGRRNLAIALYNQRAFDEAIELFEAVLEDEPDDAGSQANLGSALASVGRMKDAADRLRLAVEIKPDFPRARYQLGRALELTGAPVEALVEYRTAIEQQPDWLPPINAAAWLAATDPEVLDPEAALRDALRADTLTGHGDPVVLETLAAAYAAGGRFADAVRTAEQALVLLRGSRLERRSERVLEALEQYRSGMPFRVAAG